MQILIDTLGSEGARRFLEMALPEIRRRNETLLSTLYAKDWEQASFQAHQIKGTAVLFATPQLLDKLQKIIECKIGQIESEDFIEDLKDEFARSYRNILMYLSGQ